jgi:alpha-amylase/alpha-mannosidase (GH57 family)
LQRFVCIHGHFYQPSRENPWTRELEEEVSAHPYHDWNERITAECYARNANSPLPDGDGKFRELVNNYGWMSFNFGPTLLRWLESNAGEVYESVLEADRQSVRRFGGHGSAMAQVYNHMIMPLASPANKRTQVRWGVEDFERRFGRQPEGMWLPETAVDVDTLESLAEAQIRFTVLSPHQALAVRAQGDESWADVSGGHIDTHIPYTCVLPSGRTIALFFFDRGLSNSLAFGDLLANGDRFAAALLGGFSVRNGPQLVNVASDGETYGHHHKKGHTSLTLCITKIDGSGSASMVNYGRFLELAPPESEVTIQERTSWSCTHGVERWRSNCGCSSEIRPGYNQAWRSPLRSAVDWLESRLSDVYGQRARRVFKDLEATRGKLPSVSFERPEEMRDYLSTNLKPDVGTRGREDGERLLEMIESSALMQASCAWFWEDISRMETIQALRYAARACELARNLGADDPEPEFERILSEARPNDKRFRTGSLMYERLARRGRGRI